MFSAALNRIQAAQDALLRAGRHRRLDVVLVQDGQVVEDILALFVHPPDAVLNDHGEFVGERRIVRHQVRNRQGEHVAVAVLVLEPFARERRAAGRAAEQEAFAPRVAGGPDQVADALEAEHGVEDEERDHVDSVIRVGRAGGDERRHRAGLVDAFLEDLAVSDFLVVEQAVLVDRLVELAGVRVDAALAEQRFHAERARLVRDDRHDELADFRIAQEFGQDAHERHRRGDFAFAGAFEKFLKNVVLRRRERQPWSACAPANSRRATRAAP